LGWINTLVRTCNNKRIHKNTIREKTLCLKFLNTTKSATTTIESKKIHLKSKTLNIEMLVSKQWTLNTGF
jgi:hypothetical protein